MTSDTELERLVRPSDLRSRHRLGRGRRSRVGTIADAVVAAINALFI